MTLFGESNGDTETKSCKLTFVGLITVPSNQKTGHKKLNKYDDVFKKVNKTNQTLTIWLMSTVMKLYKSTLTIFQESCTKLHLLLYYLNL
jgi:hypothetical protein